MKNISGYEFVQQFEKVVPLWLAEEKDPVGLHVGDLGQTVRKVMVTLDVRPEVVQEAIEQNVDFILAHHPPIYRPLARLDLSDPQTRMFADLIKHDIRVYAAHTNLDNANNGMNDWLAEALSLTDVEIMDVSRTIPLKRLNVYAPKTHAQQVRDAITKAGAGNITDSYQDCSYSMSGIGRFTPVGSANPTIGEVGAPEEVEEERIEVILEENKVSTVMEALYQAHPYEEPVFEVYTIDQMQPEKFGLGRVGNLPEEMDLVAFVHHVKRSFAVEGVRVVTPPNGLNNSIKRVALCGGDAGKYYPKALQKGADVYITGDVYYHTAHDMQAAGLTVIDPGHHIEKICMPKLKEMVLEWKKTLEWDIEVIASSVDTNPFLFDHQL
ncbi:Nif3-like dinuclear metal center hexameric protein [Jeotgalibaca caeni]|uniref:Nif3-like dinuclear metal center hexameric protein n=1 Tax=Jeotgalibaca caeni TaxID=3028623 RepID=UPI00237E5565|nr:Nif3-like dinuclear metal center hexameric protein [Jeotgalibaca caeni]MDE1549060.1 Nif3-like dinuclear metal center hexameric protein [Jeotgalibaca caeni]